MQCHRVAFLAAHVDQYENRPDGRIKATQRMAATVRNRQRVDSRARTDQQVGQFHMFRLDAPNDRL